MIVRPLRRTDVAAWAEMLVAVERTDQLGRHAAAAELAEGLARPGLDLERDTLAVGLPDGALVAVSVLGYRSSSAGAADDAVFCDGSVHPAWRRRGLGTALLRHGHDRARERRAALQMRVPSEVAGAGALAKSFGMTAVRWWTEMVRDLSTPVRPANPPDDVAIHVLGPDYSADQWDEPLRAAHNATFVNSWGSAAVDAVTWRKSRTGSVAFRPAFSYAAVNGPFSEVIGYLLAFDYASGEGGARELYIMTVGTRPHWRGRGLAKSLLSRALTGAADAGYPAAKLTVDSGNRTGALDVYEWAGFTAARQAVTYRLAATR
jgi:mycothiol synthase